MENSRRNFLKKTAFFTLAGLSAQLFPSSVRGDLVGNTNEPISFTLPPLPYPYDALEPHIDKMTMEIHHTKHHQAYVNNLNKALTEGGISGVTLEDLIKNVSRYSMAVRNNAGGHWNHSFFWKIMKPGGGGMPGEKLAEQINSAFSSFEEFKKTFNDAAGKRFGSGWAWLYVDADKKLKIGSTPNQDNPLMDVSEIKGVPVLGIDVWEHAYYLKYQNKRADYVNAWWNIINWNEVAANLSLATKM